MHWRRWAAPQGHIPTPTNCGPCPHLALQIMGREQIEIRKCARWRWKTAPDWFGKSYPAPTLPLHHPQKYVRGVPKGFGFQFPPTPPVCYSISPVSPISPRLESGEMSGSFSLECCESFIRPELVDRWGESGWVSNSPSIHLLRLRYLWTSSFPLLELLGLDEGDLTILFQTNLTWINIDFVTFLPTW